MIRLNHVIPNLFSYPPYYVTTAFLWLLLLIPLVTTDPFVLGVLVLANVYAIFSTSWDILSGFTGKENFGHSLFIGVGAYGAAYLNTLLGVSPWLNLLLGGLIGALFGFLIGLPCLRLSGPYLALATVAAAGIADRLALIFSEYTGGEEGLYGLDSFTASAVWDYYISLGLLIITVVILMWIGYSKTGLILRSILFDEAASEASGIDTTRYKLGAFTVSAFFAGMAGAFYAHYQMYAGPAYLSIVMSITVIVMSVVGGMGTIVGPMLGAFLLTVLNEFLRVIGDLRLLVYAGLLVLILLFIPRGIFTTLMEHLPRKG